MECEKFVNILKMLKNERNFKKIKKTFYNLTGISEIVKIFK